MSELDPAVSGTDVRTLAHGSAGRPVVLLAAVPTGCEWHTPACWSDHRPSGFTTKGRRWRKIRAVGAAGQAAGPRRVQVLLSLDNAAATGQTEAGWMQISSRTRTSDRWR